MDLNNLLIALEDIEDDFAPICAATVLEHAAEISQLVTERTLGADLPPFEESATVEDENHNIKAETTPKNKSIREIEYNTSPSSLQNLDLQAVVNTLRYREVEEQRRKKVHKTLYEMHEKFNTVFVQKNADKEVLISKAREVLLIKNQINEETIRLKAEVCAQEELKNINVELDEIVKRNQKQFQSIFYNSIVQFQRRFRQHYESLIKLLVTPEAKAENNGKMKYLIQLFDQLINKIKGSECGIAELQGAEDLCKALETLEQCVLDALTQAAGQQKILEKQLEQQELQKQLQEEEWKQQELAKQLQQQQQQQQQAQTQPKEQAPQLPSEVEAQIPSTVETEIETTTNTSATQTSHVSEERLQFYTHITTFYQEKLERVKPLQTDDNFKKFRAACQKSINIPINAISAVNAQHLRDKFEKLYGLIVGQVVKIGDEQFSINEHPLGRDYCLLLMAKKFVNQGDSAVSSNAQAAFPVASIIVSLWKSVPDFGKIFLAYVFKESPFLVPYFIPQFPGQTVEEYDKVLGYRSTNNKPEAQDMYLKRQAGIARLYAAVMITNSAAQLDVVPHPYGIEQAWRWLTNLIALEPLPDICATMLQEMLHIFGCELWRNYGKQFVKLLIYIQQHYFPKLNAVDEGGPKARLELLLSKYLKEGQIPNPQGILPANFW